MQSSPIKSLMNRNLLRNYSPKPLAVNPKLLSRKSKMVLAFLSLSPLVCIPLRWFLHSVVWIPTSTLRSRKASIWRCLVVLPPSVTKLARLRICSCHSDWYFLSVRSKLMSICTTPHVESWFKVNQWWIWILSSSVLPNVWLSFSLSQGSEILSPTIRLIILD